MLLLGNSANGFTDVPGLETSAYADDDIISSLITFDFGIKGTKTHIIEEVTLLDYDDQKAAMELFLFDEEPSTQTVNSAASFTEADLEKLITIVSVAAGDYANPSGTSGKARAEKTGIAKFSTAKTTDKIYGYLVSSGTPTYTATDHLKLQAGFIEYA